LPRRMAQLQGSLHIAAHPAPALTWHWRT
jgi:hypothetical protein